MFKFIPTLQTFNKDIVTGSLDDIVNQIKTQVGYEVITGDCVPYYDFERDYKSEKERASNFAEDVRFAVAAVKKQYPEGKVYALDASGFDCDKNKWKNSLHFLVRGCGFYHSNKNIPLLDGFDPAVYNKNQRFRFQYCSKEGQNRVLRHYNIDTGKHTDFVYGTAKLLLVQNVEGETSLDDESKKTTRVTTAPALGLYAEFAAVSLEAKNHRAGTTTEADGCTTVNCKRLCPSMCDICERTHTSDNTLYLRRFDDGKLMRGCTRSKKMKFVSKDNTISTEDETKPVKVCKPVVCVTDAELFADRNPTLFDRKFCSEYRALMTALDTGRDVALIAKTGTGKTTAVAKASTNQEAAGMISFRRALAKKYDTDFKDFHCYLKLKKGEKARKKWICQLDSLAIKCRVDSDNSLYIDEINQVIRHLSAATFMKQHNYLRNLQTFKRLIAESRQVIIMDANMTPLDLRWVEAIRGKKFKVFINTSTPRKQTINMVETKEMAIAYAMKDLLAGRKFVIAHNGGTKHHEPLKRTLLKACPGKRILVINTATSRDEDVIAALDNPDVEWGKYDCIIYSPSVQSGVSYDMENVFDRVYGIFANRTNSSGDACQMLNRVRNPAIKKTIVHVKEHYDAKTNTVAGLACIIRAQRMHLRVDELPAGVAFNPYTELEFISNQLGDDIITAEVARALDHKNFKQNFISHQLRYGNDVVFESATKITKQLDPKIRDNVKKATAVVAKETAEELCAAVNLSIEAVDALKAKLDKQLELTMSESLSLKKYSINKFYNMKEPVTTAAWYDTYTDPKKKSVFRNSFKYFNNDMETTLDELKMHEINHSLRARSSRNEYVSTDRCVVDFFLNKPVYQKEKTIIGWLRHFGFESLDSKVEHTEAMLKTLLFSCIQNMTAHDFLSLEKKPSKMAVLKVLKKKDKHFIKTGLQFINGSLRYFGVSIKKKSKNVKTYVLKNKYIDDGIFTTHENGNIPVLGDNDEEVEEVEAMLAILGGAVEIDTEAMLELLITTSQN